jgi:single-strand DNA-binding protein
MSDTGDTITITGNVATDREFKRTTAGLAITTFRVASGRRRYDRDTGTWTDSGTNWYTVSVFRSLADHAFESLHKGDRVILTGRLRLREWENGTRRGTAIEIDAEAIGHDLLWGTTTFVKDPRLASHSHAPAGDVSTDRASSWPVATTGGETWAAPGVEAGTSLAVATASGAAGTSDTVDDGERALVAVGAGAETDHATAETPF